MSERFEVRVDPDDQFKWALRRAIEKVGDLSVPYTLITQSWFKSNRAIFALKGPGKYQDLSTRPFFAWWEPKGSPLHRQFNGGYKEYKQAKVGFVYPILKRTGRLAASLTEPSSPDSVHLTVNRTVLMLGTKVPYGPPHQDGAPKRNLPKRPFVLLGPEQVSPPEINRRRDAWIAIVENYVRQVLGEGFSSPGGV